MHCRRIVEFAVVLGVIGSAVGLIIFAIIQQNAMRRGAERKSPPAANQTANESIFAQPSLLIGTTTTSTTTSTTTTSSSTIHTSNSTPTTATTTTAIVVYSTAIAAGLGSSQSPSTPNSHEETTAWKTLTSHPNALVQLLPSRAMRVVQEVVRSLRKDTEVVVTTTMGRIRGRYQKYRSGIRGGYYSFKGIRYGSPPVGDRRFRAAEPEKPWAGIRDASREGNSCPHKNMILDTFKGDEDCLFLNVFTSKMPRGASAPKLPVMVWFHGGGYSFGSGNTFLYGPDYLVAEDVVLVTLNYRLGPLGFLSAGPDAPGNQGLKDQILALKWVRDNIAAFGGNPNEVTIFGESAGASSVQFLLLSPLAKGLFHRAISESGSALNPWSMGDSSTVRAFRLATNLGFVGANNTEEVLEFLRRVPPMKLIEAAPGTLTAEDIRNNVGLPFVPVVEGYWNRNRADEVFYEPAVLVEHPTQMYSKHEFHNDVPYMTGYNTHEAMLFIRRLRKNPLLLQIIEHDFGRLVPHDLNVTDSHERVSREIRQFYLGTKHVGLESVDEMIALLTDLMFLQGIRKTARNHAKYGKAPVFMYRFGFDGALGLYKRILGIPRPGVCHGDEMGYLFKFGFLNLSLDPRSMEVLVKNRMVRMWTNFAKYGNPTPAEIDDPLLPTTWEPINPQNVMQDINYLDITTRLDMKSNPETERQEFWDSMYEHYNGVAM